MTILDTIQERRVWQRRDGSVLFTADADIDIDGIEDKDDPQGIGGSLKKDRFFQAATSLRRPDGKFLNAYRERYMVVPGWLPGRVKGTVHGCRCRVHYLVTGIILEGVVGDDGPLKKVGELSEKYAQDLGMNPDPNNGGEDDMEMVVYELWPGVPAIVDGFQYALQPLHGPN